MSDNSDNQIWKKLDEIFDREAFDQWVSTIDKLLDAQINLDELSKASRTLADLHALNPKDSSKNKSKGYGLLTAMCFIRMKRLAPAVAQLDWMRKNCKGEDAYSFLEKEIAACFGSRDSSSKKNSAQPKDAPAEAVKDIQEEFWAEKVDTYPDVEIPLFSHLPSREVQALIQKAKLVEIDSDQSIFAEGDEPKAFYVIAEGEVEVFSRNGLKKSLKEGDFFGEIALMGRMKRTASVSAKTKLKLLEFSRDTLIESFVLYPELEERILRFFFLRLFMNSIRLCKEFDKYSDKQLLDFFYSFSPHQARENTKLFEQGDESDSVILIISGKVGIFQDGSEVSTLGAGDFVGEVAFLDGSPRSATAIAQSDCHYLQCEKYMFQSLEKTFPQLKESLQVLAQERLASNRKGSVSYFD